MLIILFTDRISLLLWKLRNRYKECIRHELYLCFKDVFTRRSDVVICLVYEICNYRDAAVLCTWGCQPTLASHFGPYHFFLRNKLQHIDFQLMCRKYKDSFNEMLPVVLLEYWMCLRGLLCKEFRELLKKMYRTISINS